MIKETLQPVVGKIRITDKAFSELLHRVEHLLTRAVFRRPSGLRHSRSLRTAGRLRWLRELLGVDVGNPIRRPRGAAAVGNPNSSRGPLFASIRQPSLHFSKLGSQGTRDGRCPLLHTQGFLLVDQLGLTGFGNLLLKALTQSRLLVPELLKFSSAEPKPLFHLKSGTT